MTVTSPPLPIGAVVVLDGDTDDVYVIGPDEFADVPTAAISQRVRRWLDTRVYDKAAVHVGWGDRATSDYEWSRPHPSAAHVESVLTKPSRRMLAEITGETPERTSDTTIAMRRIAARRGSWLELFVSGGWRLVWMKEVGPPAWTQPEVIVRKGAVTVGWRMTAYTVMLAHNTYPAGE